MVDWWVMMGAEAQEIQDDYYSHNGRKFKTHYRIRMPGFGAKWSHKFNDGSDTYMLHMKEEFAPEASLFILKWPDNIIDHDIRIPKNDYEEQNY
jgi:hypothetical protein